MKALNISCSSLHGSHGSPLIGTRVRRTPPSWYIRAPSAATHWFLFTQSCLVIWQLLRSRWSSWLKQGLTIWELRQKGEKKRREWERKKHRSELLYIVRAKFKTHFAVGWLESLIYFSAANCQDMLLQSITWIFWLINGLCAFLFRHSFKR